MLLMIGIIGREMNKELRPCYKCNSSNVYPVTKFSSNDYEIPKPLYIYIECGNCKLKFGKEEESFINLKNRWNERWIRNYV